MADPSNYDRAAWAQDAINAHSDSAGKEREEGMRDLLADLRHLAALQNLDIEAFWLGSKSVFDEEVAEEIKMVAADAANAADDAADVYHAALRAADAAAVAYRAAGVAADAADDAAAVYHAAMRAADDAADAADAAAADDAAADFAATITP